MNKKRTERRHVSQSSFHVVIWQYFTINYDKKCVLITVSKIIGNSSKALC